MSGLDYGFRKLHVKASQLKVLIYNNSDKRIVCRDSCTFALSISGVGRSFPLLACIYINH